MAHIQEDKTHALLKQKEAETNFQSLLQLQSSNAQVNSPHQHQQHAHVRPSILQTNQSIRSISSQQQQQQPSTTTTALGFYPYNSKKDDDGHGDDDAYSTVTGGNNDNDVHRNAFFNFPPKRYFNVYGNEDIAYYQQRKEQLQIYINHLVHKMQIKHSRNSNTAVYQQRLQEQQQHLQQHVSIEQVLLWFFEVSSSV